MGRLIIDFLFFGGEVGGGGVQKREFWYHLLCKRGNFSSYEIYSHTKTNYFIGYQVVVSNILQTRKKTVVIITPTQETAIWMSDSELETGKEIEEKIVIDLKKMHQQFLASSVLQGT